MNSNVSVILPVFNAARSIARSVHSILDQSWPRLELIVVDDGSTDETAAILKKIKDARLKTILTDHSGVAAAANFGLRQAQFEWIARMDADDYSYPARIEKQLQVIRADQLDVVGCQVRILDDQHQPVLSMRRYEGWINEETTDCQTIQSMRFVEFPLVNPTILASRRYFALGFLDHDMPEDYDLFLRAAEQGFRFGKCAEILLDWYDVPNGLTRSDPRYSDKAFDKCRKLHLLQGPLKNVSGVDLIGVGQTGKPWLRWLQSEGLVVRNCYDVSPKKIGQQIHGCQIQDLQELKLDDTNPLLIAVGSEGSRDLLKPFVEERGYQAGKNAWFVA